MNGAQERVRHRFDSDIDVESSTAAHPTSTAVAPPVRYTVCVVLGSRAELAHEALDLLAVR
jgi:hypothetical protein